VAAPAANGTLPRRFAILEALPALLPTRGAANVAVPVAEAGNPDQAQVARLSWRSVQ